jgi:lipopolysaccharide/colanic/teichoic acid biosynthesis glycosyltransferase
MGGNNLSSRIQLALKRLLDLVITLSGLVLVWPFIAIIALAIKLDSEGPVFYRHRRIGKDGVPFDLFKFRSMIHGGDDSEYVQYLQQLILSERDHGQALPYRKLMGDPRVTRVGQFLRRYYLDELPQVLNILRGDMSLVGPRPHVQLEVDHYTPEQRRRLTAKPGATGLWQVTNKSDSSFSELINLDLFYIDQWNLWLDLEIIIKTLGVIARGGEEFWTRIAKRIPVKSNGTPVTQEAIPVEGWAVKPTHQEPVEEDLRYTAP